MVASDENYVTLLTGYKISIVHRKGAKISIVNGTDTNLFFTFISLFKASLQVLE